MGWFAYAVAAAVTLGIAMAFYKLPAMKGHSGIVSAFWSNLVAGGLSAVVLVISGPEGRAAFVHVSWYALLWGACFAVNMIQVKALLQSVDTVAAYSVTSPLSTVGTTALGMIVLAESATPVQLAGMVVVIAAVIVAGSKGGTISLRGRTLLLVVGAVITSILSKFVQKQAAVHDPIERVMVWQYVGACVCTFVAACAMERRSIAEFVQPGKYLRDSLLIGTFLAVGGYLVVRALAVGPLSGVYVVMSCYIFATAAVCRWLYKEMMTPRKVVCALVGVVGVIMLKVG